MSSYDTSKRVRETSPSYRAGHRRRWSIVLAGGQGSRMSDWIAARRGESRPKQFCAFTGSRTMLEHTLDRAAQVAPDDHIVTVIGRGQRRYLNGDTSRIPGMLVEQPADRGTAAGVLLSATFVRASDPGATVLILPSDHFVRPDHRFRLHASSACDLTDRFPDRFIVLGAIAEAPETDYGWILPERRRLAPLLRRLDREVRPVARFREKPTDEEAVRLFDSGALWNTMVLAVRVETLWAAGRRLLPGMMDRFEFLYQVLRSVRAGRASREREAAVLHDIYLDMRPADFSRAVLERVASSTLVQPLREVEWNDWGRPERVERTLLRLIDGGRRDNPPPTAPPSQIPAWRIPAERTSSGVTETGDRT